MTRYWTTHWRYIYWRPDANDEGRPIYSSGSNSYRKRGVSVNDKVYIVSLAEGQLYLGGRMTVKQIMSREEAIRSFRDSNLYDATEWIIDPDKSGTLLSLRRRLAPDLSRSLRFVSPRSAPKPLFFNPGTDHLYCQATRGVRELTPESAAALDSIIEITDRLPRSNQIITVTKKHLQEGRNQTDLQPAGR